MKSIEEEFEEAIKEIITKHQKYQNADNISYEDLKKKNDKIEKLIEKGECYIGFVYVTENSGMKFYIDGKPKNIANFIMTHAYSLGVVITDMGDNFILSAGPGGYLDRISDPALRGELLDYLIPMQERKKKPEEPIAMSIIEVMKFEELYYEREGNKEEID